MSANQGNVLVKAGVWYVMTALIIGTLVFVPAGSLKFWNGWLLMAIVFIPMFFVLVYLSFNDPELLEKRLNLKEREKPQRLFQAMQVVIYLAVFIIPGLDHRFKWSRIPLWLVWLSGAVTLPGYKEYMQKVCFRLIPHIW